MVSDVHFGQRMDVLHIVYCFIYVALLDRAVIILACELVALQSASPFRALPCGYLPNWLLPTVWSTYTYFTIVHSLTQLWAQQPGPFVRSSQGFVKSQSRHCSHWNQIYKDSSGSTLLGKMPLWSGKDFTEVNSTLIMS